MTHTADNQRGNLNGRAAAVLAVADALTGKRFASETLSLLRASGRLPAREAGLATEIALGTLRHTISIEHILQRLARYRRERTPARLRTVLCTATYQLIWTDRIPAFAAVNTAVEMARRFVGGRAPGMANAVLRRVADAVVAHRTEWERLNPRHIRVNWNRACAFERDVLPPATSDDDGEHLAAAAGESASRYEQLRHQFGAVEAETIAWAAQATPAIVLHRNPLHATPDAFTDAIRAINDPQAIVTEDRASISPGAPILESIALLEGLAYIQDPTAHAAASAINPKPDEQILDLCAAPGGKSIAMALAMRNRGRVTACDIDANRLAKLDASIVRLRLSNIRTRLLNEESPEPAEPGRQYDAALVDVPCSNTGVIARRPEARFGLTPRKLASLIELQRKLLARAARWVRPNGRLVYSTCSIEPDENERVVAAFIRAHDNWKLQSERLQTPTWGPRTSDWRDGGYYAHLQRRD